MRALKFRAWDKENEVYLSPDDTFIIAGNGYHPATFSSTFGYTANENLVIEQYTGLNDKNGKEIYEGDIIHRGALSKANVFRNSVICFDEESVGFIATSTRNGARTLFNGHTCDEVEVIGNVHENPELAGGEK